MTYSAEAAGAHGIVRCHVVRQQFDFDGRAPYSIVVCNESSIDVHAHAFVADTPGDGSRSILQTRVGPHSDFSTILVVERGASGWIPDVNVAVSAGEIAFTLAVPALRAEARERARADERSQSTQLARAVAPAARLARGDRGEPAPPVATRPGARDALGRSNLPWFSPPLMRIVLGGTALVISGGFVVFRPQITQLAVAPVGPAAATAPVRYTAGGLGSADFTLLESDGRRIDGGPLGLGSGTFRIRLPRSSDAQTLLLRVRVANPFGAAVAETYVPVPGRPAPRAQPRRAAPPPPSPVPAPPQIRSLALARAALTGGDTLDVYYDVLATSGSVALVDPAAQVTYGRVNLSSAGHAAFVLPRTDVERDLSVVVTAARGAATTESRVGVTVMPPAAPGAASLEPAAAAPDMPSDARNAAAFDTQNGGSPSALTIFAPPAVHAGQPIRVTVDGANGDLTLRLLDAEGGELARNTVRAGARVAELTAPAVTAPARCVLEATAPRGSGSETVVRPIAVLP